MPKVQAASAELIEMWIKEEEEERTAPQEAEQAQEDEGSEQGAEVQLEVAGAAASTTSDSNRHRWFFKLRTLGGSILALVDPGSEVTVISEEEVARRGYVTEKFEIPLVMRLLDANKESKVRRYVPRLPLSKGTWQG